MTKVSKQQDVKYEEQESANLKKFEDESTSERDSSTAEFLAMVQYPTQLNDIRVVKEDTYGENMRRRTADTAGPKGALTIIFEKNRKPNGSLACRVFCDFRELCAENDLSNLSRFIKQSRTSARLFVSIQKFYCEATLNGANKCLRIL